MWLLKMIWVTLFFMLFGWNIHTYCTFKIEQNIHNTWTFFQYIKNIPILRFFRRWKRKANWRRVWNRKWNRASLKMECDVLRRFGDVLCVNFILYNIHLRWEKSVANKSAEEWSMIREKCSWEGIQKASPLSCAFKRL